MKYKRQMSFLLVLLLLTALLAACGSSTDAQTSGSTEPSQESEMVEQTETAVEEDSVTPEPETAPAQTQTAEETAEAPQDTDPAEETRYNDMVITYPLSEEPVTLSIFCTKPGGPPIVRDSWAELEIFQNAEEYLGVSIDWREADMMVYDTQFNLMCASGDWADIIAGVVQNYSTGATGAYDDGIILDIADLVYDNMPNYWNYVHTDSEVEKYVMTEEGLELAVYVVNDQPLTERGLLIRSDWLDALGLAVPETFEELEETLIAFKNEYNCTDVFSVDNGVGIPSLTSGYDIAYFEDDLALYVDDNGQLVCSYMTDAYRDYLQMMNRWYQEGLFDGDKVLSSATISMNDVQTLICNENVGLFYTSGNQLSTYYTYSVNPDFDVTPINVIVQNSGDDSINHFADYEPVQSGQTVSVSTTCADPELALRWIDYWYSDEGTMTMTYGIEDYTYTVAEDGTVTYTDMIVNNEHNMSPEGMIMRYNCQGKICGVMLQKANWAYYSDKQKEVTDFWSSQVAYDRSIPGYVTLNTEETLAYNAITTDIITYAEAELNKFLFGMRDFSEWDAFTAELETMGIYDAIAIYQAAYDRQVS